MNIIRRIATYILLVSLYGITLLVAVLGRMIPRRPWKPTSRIMVTGTFFNPNWYLSHMTPLTRSGVTEVVLIVDEPQLPLDRVRFVCPPRWASRLFSRAGAKAIWMIVSGLRYRPDLYMGYYLVPGACSAMMAGKLLGRPTCYQMTAGPVEIVGGGFQAMGSLSETLGRSSKVVEAMALAVVRLFELIVVRGNKAKRFLTAHDMKGSIAIVTGSVHNYLQLPQADREIHLIFLGRLVPTKQVDQFITIVGAVFRVMPSVKAAIIGDGPLMTDLQNYTEELGLTRNIEFLGKQRDVESLLIRSKVFVLTSKSEGLSIAMAEAMVAGVVPVVADVGELGDLVTDGVNGYLIEPNNVDEYANRIISLLRNDPMWTQFSHKAIEAAKEHCDIELVSEKWRKYLRDAVSQASGCYPEDVWN